MSDSPPITWFTENPAPIIITGIVALFLLGFIFLKSGRGVVLLGMGGVTLLMGLAVLIDRLVVTDREQVANVIYEMAADAQRNDLNAVINHISPTAGDVRAEARHWIGQAKLESVSVSAMEVKLDRIANPPKATAEFRAFAQGTIVDKNGSFPVTYLGRLIVKFQREGDRWLVTAYERDR